MDVYDWCSKQGFPSFSMEKSLCPGLVAYAKKLGFDPIPFTVSDNTKEENRVYGTEMQRILDGYESALKRGAKEVEL